MERSVNLPKVIHPENSGYCALPDPLTPKPLLVTLREFNKGKEVSGAGLERGHGEGVVGRGMTAGRKMLGEERRVGAREQQDHRDERLDARVVLTCLDWASAVMEPVEGPGNTDLVSEGGWELQRSLRARYWRVRCLLSSVGGRFFPDLGSMVGGEARGTDSTEMGLRLYLLSHLPPSFHSYLPSSH